MTDAHGSEQYDYDALGRQVRQARVLDGVAYPLQRRYATSGQLTGITWPDGDAFGTPAAPITYDAAGRMKSVPGIVTSAIYDALGRPAQRDQANGTVTMWSFDERGALRRIQTTSTGEPGGVIQDLQYTPDALGRVETVTSPFPNESWSYGYDLLGRLQTATSLYDPAQSQAFDYDLAGNKTYDSRIGTISYPLPGSPRPHAPTAVAGQPMTYDPNGNLVSGRGRSYDWNVDNKPTTVNGVSFAYAGDGTRLKKTAPGGTTLYPLGDDYEIKDGVATKYLRLGGPPIAKRVGATSYWLHADRLGSVQAVTDAAGQNALRRTYRPYGQKIADSTSHWEPLGYIGERLDEETGLTYLHARYYDSELGTFVSPDTLDPDTPGVGYVRFGYSGGDPVNRIDPSGKMMVITCLRFESGIEYCLSPINIGGDLGVTTIIIGVGAQPPPPPPPPPTPPETPRPAPPEGPNPGEGEGPGGLPGPLPAPCGDCQPANPDPIVPKDPPAPADPKECRSEEEGRKGGGEEGAESRRPCPRSKHGAVQPPPRFVGCRRLLLVHGGGAARCCRDSL